VENLDIMLTLVNMDKKYFVLIMGIKNSHIIDIHPTSYLGHQHLHRTEVGFPTPLWWYQVDTLLAVDTLTNTDICTNRGATIDKLIDILQKKDLSQYKTYCTHWWKRFSFTDRKKAEVPLFAKWNKWLFIDPFRS
jgi:hypothetical protein